MTLLLILLGIALIIAIARYNEDDSLFWKLLVCFIGCIIAACIAKTIITESNRSKADLTQTSPTQECLMVSPAMFYALCAENENLLGVPVDICQKPVSKDKMSVKKISNTSSEVFAAARDQPNLFAFFDTS